jgi:hypothetical protein
LLDCRAPKESEERWVSLDLLANLEYLDLKVLLAVTEVGLWPGTFLAGFFSMGFLDGFFFFRGSERVGPTE